MTDVFKRLAKKLDGLPQGFPATESGVELAILRKIFSPEDAAMALRLKPVPETPAQIARRLKRSEEETREIFEGMASRGQIYSFKIRGQRRYALAPFVVGIFEFQLNRIDRELAQLCEEYAPHLAMTLGGKAPHLARVVPVNRPIDPRTTVLAYEDTRTMIEDARSFQLMDCICRVEKAVQGQPCSHTLETCLAFSKEEDAYEGSGLRGRSISRDEALAVLDAAETEGLVHCTYNFEHDQMFVCNCCSCCCGFLRLLTEFHSPYGLVRSNWVTRIDHEICAVCGTCADERCPVEAIEETDGGGYRVLEERCIGCGVCVVTCPTEAMLLETRPEDQRTTPPRNIVDWSVQRTANRSGPFKSLVLRGWLAWQGMGASRTPESPDHKRV
ncbi:MAG: ATP-binding protein [Thermoanaerobaculales bacterium]